MKAKRLPNPLAMLIVALGAAVGLAGCGGVANDPMLAGRVNSHPITLTAYQSILRLNTANAAASGSALEWQSPGGRATLASTQHDTFDFLVDLELMREQASQHNITVTADEQKRAKDLISQQIAQLDQAITKSPGNQSLRDLRASLTPDVQTLLSQRVGLLAVLAKASIFPSWHVRGILVSDITTASTVLQKANAGEDFAALAKQYSQDTQTGQSGGEIGRIFPGQISTEFSAIAFGKNPQKTFMIPFSGEQYAVFQIDDEQKTSLDKAGDSTAQQQVLTSWINDVVRHAANVERYVTI